MNSTLSGQEDAPSGDLEKEKLALEVAKLKEEIRHISKTASIQSRNGWLVAASAFASLLLVGVPQLIIAYRAQDTAYSQDIAKLVLTVQAIKDDGERGRMLRILHRVWPDDFTLRTMLDTNQPLAEQMAGDDTIAAGSDLPIDASRDQICVDARQRLARVEDIEKSKGSKDEIEHAKQLKRALNVKIDSYRCP